MKITMNHRRAVAIVAGLATLVAFKSTSHARPIEYSQNPLFGNGNSFPAEVAGGNQADNWTAITANSIGLFRWWGTQAGPSANSGSFTLNIYSNSGGLPGGFLNSFSIGNAYVRTATGQTDFNGRDIYKYEANIGSFNPTASATYWLSIVNNVSVSGNPGFLWHEGGGGDGAHAFRVGTGSWSSIGGDMAFQLESIPTPGALVLIGLAAMTSRRRRM